MIKKLIKEILHVFTATCSYCSFGLLGAGAHVVFFSIYEAAPAASSNYSPQSCLHVSDDTDKTSQPQLRHEPEVMWKYAAHDQQKYGDRQEFQKFDCSPL